MNRNEHYIECKDVSRKDHNLYTLDISDSNLDIARNLNVIYDP